MKILHITGAKGWGGNEQQLIDSCIELNKLAVENYIFCYKNSLIEKESLNKGIYVINSSDSRTFSLAKGKQLKKIIQNYNIDLIHLHTSDSVTTFVLADMIYDLKCPAIFSKKGVNSSIKKGLSAFKYNYKNIKKVICVSKVVLKSFKTTLKSKNHHKLIVIHDTVNIERLKPNLINLKEKFAIEDNTFIIGNIANHTKAKDLITLIETANYLINNLLIKNIAFIQIGKYSRYTEDIIYLIKSYKLQEYFILTDFQENASGYINQFDAYISSSEREGGPTTLIEAIVQKKPVVVTKTGIAEEIINHKVNGLLSNIKDHKSLAENIKFLITNPEIASDLKNNAYKVVSTHFNSELIAKKTLDIYKQAIN